MSDPPVNIGLVGLSGYAETVLAYILEAEDQAQAPIRLTGVHAIDFDRHDTEVADLKRRGVELFDSYEDLLASSAEAVWLPVPIHLHAPFTLKALKAGKAVMCEKPAAGCVQDVDQMIRARDEAGLPVLIGYNVLPNPSTRQLKQRLLDGCIGEIQEVVVTVAIPRALSYYGRNDWAGKCRHGGTWVMDSPPGNAFSHFVNLGLFLAGEAQNVSAAPMAVEAELYRVNAIENYDTASIRVTLDTGAKCLILMTHACLEWTRPNIVLRGTQGSATWSNQSITVESPNGPETINPEDARILSCIRTLAHVTRNDDDPRDMTPPTLELARNPVVTVNAASEATPVIQVNKPHAMQVDSPKEGLINTILGVESLIHHCKAHGQMFHESGLAQWSRPAGVRDGLNEYTYFAGPKL